MKELNNTKKTSLINLLSEALINEGDSIYLVFVAKGAIKRYVSIIYPYLQETRKQKLKEQKEKEAKEKAMEKVLPNNMEGQEILDFVKDKIDEMIQIELNKSTLPCEKPIKKEKVLNEDYEQLKLPLI